MKMMLKRALRTAFNSVGLEVHLSNPAERTEPYFHSHDYLRHNARRLEHLASLGIPVSGTTVLEVGAGIGDHSHYYIDRGCKVTITDVRPDNLKYLRLRYPGQNVQFLNLEQPAPISSSRFDVVHCYGLLYHLSNPEEALTYLSRLCAGMLFLETCVSFGDKSSINLVQEDAVRLTQAHSGTGCRPTRIWLFERLKGLFEFVYVPKTQPNHEEFPLDWANSAAHGNGLSRSIFIASRAAIDNPLLSPTLLDKQARHA
jgi:hypothetical protein